MNEITGARLRAGEPQSNSRLLATDRVNPSELAAPAARPGRIFQLKSFGYARHDLSQAHAAAILNEIAPFIIDNSARIARIEIVGFSIGTAHHHYHAEQRAINVRNTVLATLREKFGAPASLLTKIELAASHRPLPVPSRGASNPEDRKVAILVFFHDEEEGSLIPTADATSDTARTRTPGKYYRVKRGDTLLGIAGRAYRVSPGAARLAYARFINGHPLNRRYYVPGSGDFVRTYFANGIVSFLPRFTCADRTSMSLAAPASSRCFPLIYLPETSVLDRNQRSRDPARSNSRQTNVFAGTSALPATGTCPASRSTTVLDASRIPLRWTCRIEVTFANDVRGQGSGFLIAPDIMLTAGHNLFSIKMGRERFPKPVFAKRIKASFGLNKRKTLRECEFDVVEAKNMLVAGQWQRAVKSFLAIPAGANLDRRMHETTAQENQFDFGIVRIPKDLANTLIERAATIRNPRGSKEKFGHWGSAGSNTIVDSKALAAIAAARKSPLRPFVHISGYPSQPGCTGASVLRNECIEGVLTDVNALLSYQPKPAETGCKVCDCSKDDEGKKVCEDGEGKKICEDSGGSSGGPIFINEQFQAPMRNGPPIWRLIGVHGHVGHGVILTKGVLAEIEQMKKKLR